MLSVLEVFFFLDTDSWNSVNVELRVQQ